MPGTTATLARGMQVEIWSDVVCPWCYLGERRFAQALERVEGDVDVVFRSFQLDPTVPSGGLPLAEYLARKYGGAGRVTSSHARLDQAGSELGIEFRWEGKQRFNSFDAHRLAAWALATSGPTAQARVIDRLFAAYFTHDDDISDPATLARIAAESELDPELATEVLGGDAYGDRVRADQAAAVDLGISAVPSFVIEGAWLVPGAQDVDTFVRVLERAAERFTAGDDGAGDGGGA